MLLGMSLENFIRVTPIPTIYQFRSKESREYIRGVKKTKTGKHHFLECCSRFLWVNLGPCEFPESQPYCQKRKEAYRRFGQCMVSTYPNCYLWKGTEKLGRKDVWSKMTTSASKRIRQWKHRNLDISLADVRKWAAKVVSEVESEESENEGGEVGHEEISEIAEDNNEKKIEEEKETVDGTSIRNAAVLPSPRSPMYPSDFDSDNERTLVIATPEENASEGTENEGGEVGRTISEIAEDNNEKKIEEENIDDIYIRNAAVLPSPHCSPYSSDSENEGTLVVVYEVEPTIVIVEFLNIDLP